MKILVACEFSGVVREAFRKRGHEAYSCDVVDAEDGGPHLKGDALEAVKEEEWDMMIAHPPCTYLSVAGIRWMKGNEQRQKKQREAIMFFEELLTAPVKRKCLENPKPMKALTDEVGTWQQTVSPWWFGDGFSKRTCLWLRGLPPLLPTEIAPKGETVVFDSGKRLPKWYSDLRDLPKEEQQKERSRFSKGMAEAMAQQWG